MVQLRAGDAEGPAHLLPTHEMGGIEVSPSSSSVALSFSVVATSSVGDAWRWKATRFFFQALGGSDE